MKTAVYGSWHLASVYGTGLASLGHEVLLMAPAEVIDGYQKGQPPVLEPGLTEGILALRESGKLGFSSDITDRKNQAEFCFFAEDCKVTEAGVDMGHFRRLFDPVAASGLFKTIIVSSQLPLGTCRILQNEYPAVRIVYFPEFLRLGDGLERFLKPDYLVLGGDPSDTSRVLQFFSGVECPKFEVTLEEAEMTKHAANIFAALSVSFVSELTKFSELFDVNLEKVGKILRNDKRVGSKAYVMPGMGFSGETVERDIRVLLHLAGQRGIDLPLFREIIAVNNTHNQWIENKLRELFQNISGVKIGFLGATYKPFTSTLRGSLFAELMERLASGGASVILFDPHVADSPFLTSNPADVFDGADAVVVSVPKKEFREIPYSDLTGTMRRKIIVDAANLFEKNQVMELGLEKYFSIGRGRI